MTADRQLLTAVLAAMIALTSLTSATGAPTSDDSQLLPRSQVRPAALGSHGHQRFEVNRGNIVDIGAPHPAEFTSEATLPARRLSEPLPLVVFLHGAHPSCYQPGQNDPTWPCPPGYRPIPSHQGYRYLANRLATQGFASVSISANGVNGQEDSFADGGTSARAQLVRTHLHAIRKSAAGHSQRYPRRFARHVDLSRVLLVGHSRGTAGVSQAAAESINRRSGYRIRGIVSLAGTTQVKQAVPGIPLTALLPQCDGDVFDLESQQLVDVGARIPRDTALRTAIWLAGGNHNFLNTQWTPGLSVAISWNDAAKLNDSPGPCELDRRIGKAQERRVARSFVAANARLHLLGDDKMLQFLDGTAIRPGDVGRIPTRTSATGGSARLIERRWHGTVRARGVTAGTAYGLASAEKVDWNDVETPHWLPALRFPRRSTQQRTLEMSWQRPGTALHRLPGPIDLRSFDRLQARIALDSIAGSVGRMSLAVRDSSGVTAQVPVPRRQLVQLGDAVPFHLWGQSASVPLRQFAASDRRLDLGSIRWIGMSARSGSGRAWMLDAWARSDTTQTPRTGRAVTVVADGSARWLGDGYRVTLVIRGLHPAQHSTKVNYQLSGYSNSGSLKRGQLTLPNGKRLISRTFTVAAKKSDDRLVVATYPDRHGLNLTDYVWLPVTGGG